MHSVMTESYIQCVTPLFIFQQMCKPLLVLYDFGVSYFKFWNGHVIFCKEEINFSFVYYSKLFYVIWMTVWYFIISVTNIGNVKCVTAHRE